MIVAEQNACWNQSLLIFLRLYFGLHLGVKGKNWMGVALEFHSVQDCRSYQCLALVHVPLQPTRYGR